MQTLTLSDIGPSAELREAISKTDVRNSSVSLILDKPRSLTVVSKKPTNDALVVRCCEGKDIIILTLPYAINTRGKATIVIFEKES